MSDGEFIQKYGYHEYNDIANLVELKLASLKYSKEIARYEISRKKRRVVLYNYKGEEKIIMGIIRAWSAI